MVVLCWLCWYVEECEARSKYYYDIVNDIDGGKNYYDILGISPQASPSEIRKAFRQLALTLHPDKASGTEQAYLDVVRANEVLGDDEGRKEYDDLLHNGIPWQVNYYGKYAHKYGAPDVDVRYVLLGLVSFISLVQYFSQLYKHYHFIELAKKTTRYQHQLKALQYEKKNKKSRFEDEDEVPLHIVGAEKPKVMDLFGVTLVLFPFHFCRFIYKVSRAIYKYKILGVIPTGEEKERALRERLKMTEEEWEEHKIKQQQKEEEFKSSAKYKQAMRYLRKMKKQT